MLDHATRTAILELKSRGCGVRQIARTLRISRGAVRKVLALGTPVVPEIERPRKADPYKDEILDQYASCKGNLVRVHEELVDKKGAGLSYQALTAFCRKHSIGHEPAWPAGSYDFKPGQEMQHDTSPHRAWIGGAEQPVQTASEVLCYSRVLFFQFYPVFNRFYCKVFLKEAAEYNQGVCAVCMIDNTHVVVASGTGARMVPAPEMAAFAERYGFSFRAHEKGDADRSARVERPFHFIENNFLAGRRFADWDDLNRQAVAFCDKVNAKTKRHLGASPRELFATERAHMRPLPLFVPEVYRLHDRIVDVEGFVSVDSHRYSAPYTLIGRRLEVRETKDRIDIYQGPRLVASHRKLVSRTPTRVALPEHRPRRGERPSQRTTPEEQELQGAEEALSQYAEELKKRSAGRGTLALRRLLALRRDYPSEAFLKAVTVARQYGLFDLDRLERLTLRMVAKDFFVVGDDEDGEDND